MVAYHVNGSNIKGGLSTWGSVYGSSKVSVASIWTLLNPLSPSGTYMVHEKSVFLSTPGLQWLTQVRQDYSVVFINRYIFRNFLSVSRSPSKSFLLIWEVSLYRITKNRGGIGEPPVILSLKLERERERERERVCVCERASMCSFKPKVYTINPGKN